MEQNPQTDAATGPVVVERTYDAPADRVWKAISDKEQMKKWYFDFEAFSPEVGFEFRFTGGTETRQYLHICTIEEVVRLKRLKYSWRYDGYEGISYVTFELFAQGDQTRIKLTHEGLETFPKENPDFARVNFVEGWTSIIGSSLKEYVEAKR